MNWRHDWKETAPGERVCTKCGTQQTKKNVTQGTYSIRIPNPRWLPLVSLKCKVGSS